MKYKKWLITFVLLEAPFLTYTQYHKAIVIGVDFNGVLIKKYAPKTFGPIPGILDVLNDVKKSGYDIFVVSNTAGEKLNKLFKQYADEFKVIDGIYAPAQESGLRKSDTNFFLSLRKWLAKRGFTYTPLLLFDDQQKYVDNANQASKEKVSIVGEPIPVNIEAFLFISPTQMRELLIHKGILTK